MDGRYSVTLADSRQEYGDVWTFSFQTEEPVPYLAGQYAHLKLLGLETGSVHEFSFSSAPEEAYLSFTIRLRQESEYKQFLKRMGPGAPAEIFKIKGEFTLQDEGPSPIFIAQGIAITPVRSIVKDRSVRNLPLPRALIHVDRGPYLFEGELSPLPFSQYRIGRSDIDATLENLAAQAGIASSEPEVPYYVIGSPEFVLNISEKLQSLGIAETRLKTDDWGY